MLFKNKRLQQALKAHDTKTAKECIEDGASCDRKWLSSFLRKSLTNNNINAIKVYCECGFDIERSITDSSAETMLYFASRMKRLEIVQYLISQNAIADCYNRYGRSVLYATAVHDSPSAADIIKELVNAGANINYQDESDKKTAVIVSSFYNRHETTKTLIDLGADLSLTDNKGKTAWDHSGSYNRKLFPEYKIEQGERTKQKNIKLETAKKHKKHGRWTACFNQSVACMQNSEEIKRELTEVFNFPTKEVTIIIRNTNTDVEHCSKESFAQYKNRERLETACLEYNSLPDTDTPVNVDDILNIKTKIIDGKITSKTPITINAK